MAATSGMTLRARGRRTMPWIVAGLGALGVRPAHGQSRVDLLNLLYQESDGRTQVMENLLLLHQDLGESLGVADLTLTHDTISGASPTGAYPKVDVTTSASGTGSSTAFPMARDDNHRNAGSFAFGRKFGAHLPTVDVSYGKEDDYVAREAGLSDTWTLFGGRGALHYGLSQGSDLVEPITNHLHLPRKSVSYAAGWTWILDSDDLVDVSLSRTRLHGYLDEPYKVVPVGADPETCGLVRAALELARLTEGRFDPTVGVLSRAWDFRRGRVPSACEVASLLPLVDAAAVRVEDGSVFLERSGMELDLGGVGKEYAVDCVTELLRAEGVASAIVNFAGDVRTLGRRGDGRPWSIGVQDPRARGCRFAIRAPGRAGVATSGDYERFFERDGVRYHHLLDATTGRPARGLASATVVAPTAFAAGRLATAAFLLGPQRGLDLLEGIAGVEGALITETGALLCTSGMARITDLALRPGA